MTTAVLIQLVASLVAVLFIAWLVGRMGLGADPRIADDAHAIRLADEAETGFGGVEVARDRAGFAAIVRNAEGRMLLIRAHGNHFAARPVDAGVEGRLDKDFLTLRMPERTFGAVTLHLGKEAGVWASRMREVSGRSARPNEAAPARSPTRPPTEYPEMGGRAGERAGAAVPSSKGGRTHG
ncbi:hypothetical protein [Sphingopyxis indica]|uniref:Photosynthetic complex assembly protein n=1 Tax=Sphingopyxis indica TaxID=436663 RepID=A0A239HN00_9SPHN|nr:hypothetical protein [Sphingopyxis indica]SNS82710.1 hypothetical protein SAMN06295955_10629 [Sphingopyxis indica]